MDTLTLEQAYYLGELLSASIVALSIMFLIFEIRQNSKSIKLASAHDMTSRHTDFLCLLTQDREITDLWVRGLQAFDSLDQAEQARFVILTSSSLQTFDELYFHQSRTSISKSGWPLRLINPVVRSLSRR